MSTIEEKRVYGDRAGDTTLHLATGTGVVTVSVAEDRVGTFGVERRCDARDLAVVGDRLAVATDEDLLVGDEATGFGPAVAVGGTDAPIAAGPDGRIARREDEWIDRGRLEGVRAIDGDLLATAEGVYRVGATLRSVGLEAVTDVSAAGVPLAATEDGLYRLGNGWMDELEGAFAAVAADRRTAPGGLDRAVAAGESGLVVYDGDEWTDAAFPADPAAIAVADAVYAATADGELFVDAGNGWRSRTLGIGDVRAMAVA